MTRSLVSVALLIAAALGAPTVAQDEQGGAGGSLQDRILRAILLPRTTSDAREAGVAEEELQRVLRAGREQRVPVDEMEMLLREEVRAVHEHGPIDNFGAFVQERLDRGLRGPALAAAIRAEHAARGKGPGAGKAAGKGPPVRKGAGPQDRGGAGDDATGQSKGKRGNAGEDGR